jgi:poly(A) polymerase
MNNITDSLRKWFDRQAPGLSPLYLVGGTVRDLLLNNLPKDIDLVCRNAKEIASDIAKRKNAALVPMEKKPDEPCYRIVNRQTPDNFLDITEMRGETIYEDLDHRDFTINAVAVKINQDCTLGDMIDPLNGAGDIAKKIVRMINEKSIVSDPLRILRAIRFSAMLDFSVEHTTLEEIGRSANLLKDVSSERIMGELCLILKSHGSSRFFRQMDDLGILEIIFPEIVPMKGCAQNGFHHKNVWEHSLLVMESCEEIISNSSKYFKDLSAGVAETLAQNDRLPLLKLAALLHDTGKPATRGLNPDTGRITFYGHDEEGAKLVGLIADRLKMSGRSRDFMVLMAAEHLHILHLASNVVKSSTKMKWFRKMGDDSVPAIILSMADVMGILGPDATEEYRERHMEWSTESVINYYKEIKAKIESPDLITGHDLIVLGMKPGPEIGRVLARVRDARDAGEIAAREDAIEMAKILIG